jgi:hypothetical protein
VRAITHRFELLEPHLDMLLGALATLPALTLSDGSAAERLPGRTRSDWDDLPAGTPAAAGAPAQTS